MGSNPKPQPISPSLSRRPSSPSAPARPNRPNSHAHTRLHRNRWIKSNGCKAPHHLPFPRALARTRCQWARTLRPPRLRLQNAPEPTTAMVLRWSFVRQMPIRPDFFAWTTPSRNLISPQLIPALIKSDSNSKFVISFYPLFESEKSSPPLCRLEAAPAPINRPHVRHTSHTTNPKPLPSNHPSATAIQVLGFGHRNPKP